MTTRTSLLALLLASTFACSIDGSGYELEETEVFGGAPESGFKQAGWIAEKNPSGKWEFRCGGVFLGNRMIATAAHCVEHYFTTSDDNEINDLVFSDKDLFNKRVKFGFGDYRPEAAGTFIRRVTLHPHWERGQWDGKGNYQTADGCKNQDLAIIELADKPNVSVVGATIASPVRTGNNKENWKHKVIGYGSTNITEFNDGTRRSIDQNIRTRTGKSKCPNKSDDCESYPKGPASGVFMAVSHDVQTPCVGDSGSPLFIKDGVKYTNQEGKTVTANKHVVAILLGSVTQDGRDRCRPGEQIAYTSLMAHAKFIEFASVMNDEIRKGAVDRLKDTTERGECYNDNFEDNIDPYAEDGSYGGACVDECATAGTKECADDLDYLECGQFDDDACLEKGAFSCSQYPGTTCSGGVCVGEGGGGCTNQCTTGSRQCTDSLTYQECADSNGDGCTEWVGSYTCTTWEGTTCEGGWCVGQ